MECTKRSRCYSKINTCLLPAALEHKVDLLGNAAGKGAAAALFPEGRAALESVAASCSHVELSTSPTFAGLYLDAMGFEP